ncbi:MAG: ankyrin repeat domain-containing protein [Epsilonproteobacteria bacterium]|nr:ankyrin repeat domain-containing protein [Campylobacterota bacterium]
MNNVTKFTLVASLIFGMLPAAQCTPPINPERTPDNELLRSARDGRLTSRTLAILLNAGANLNATSPTGWTALDYAQAKGHVNIIALLQSLTQDVPEAPVINLNEDSDIETLDLPVQQEGEPVEITQNITVFRVGLHRFYANPTPETLTTQ